MQKYATDGVLAGSLDGQKAFADLVQQTQPPQKPEVCFLDFTGVDVATTSFLRDSVIAYRKHIRSRWTLVYPVGANLSSRVCEELSSWMVEHGDAFVTCTLDAADQISDVRVIGQIDGKQSIALQGVLELGETDVSGLAAHLPEKVAQTAWNNRLSMLAQKGILVEITNGRNKRYRPVLEGLKYGA